MFLLCCDNSCNADLEIGHKLFVVMLTIVIVIGVISLLIIILKHIDKCKKICQECKSRNLMYSFFCQDIFKSKYDVEVKEDSFVKTYTISINKFVNKDGKNNEN